MTVDVLIRGLSKEDLAWLDANVPSGFSRNEFLKSVIAKTRGEAPRFRLFDEKSSATYLAAGPSPKFVDLFAGIGGFRIGLAATGATCVFTNEWDKYAQRTYTTWFGHDHFHGGDIRSAEVIKRIPDHDILCAGFPCQPFSLAGVSKKKSLGRAHGFEDKEQGNLFFAITRIIDEHRPPVVFLENVKNLRSHDAGNTWRVIKNELESRYYAVFDEVLDANGWVPQHRERIFVVAFDKTVFGEREDIDFKYPDPPNKSPVLGDVLEEEPESKYMLTDKLWNYLKAYRKKHEKKGNGFGYSLFDATHTTRTLSARYHKDGSEILVSQPGWRNPRRLTPREAMRLMGFTDEYAARFGFDEGFPIAVSDTQAYRQFGNAVVPLVVESVATEIMRVIGKLYNRSGNGCVIKGRRLKVA